ncbi:helix-turn-helix transcriptional regulator [Diaminobutyricibacter sp. McL0618]|uniref:helix-turn-helix transcriptional regulator n=1 Tax=Leifsonia sp. McL0618 TaxID=3415677 RepID=UPI003CFA475B
MTRRTIALVDQASDAARILGVQVRVARHAQGWTAEQLGERSGVSERTVLQVENGSPSVSIGNALNVAAVAGVPLFDITDPRTLSRVRASMEQALTLIPSNVRNRKEHGVSTDF